MRRIGCAVAETEEGKALGFHGNLFTGARIAASITAVFLHLKTAEPADLHTAAFKEGILHAVHKRVDHKGRLIQRNVGLISQGFDQLAFVHDNSVKSAVLL